MIYQNIIHDIDKTLNPAGVEANMRLMYGTLDHLNHQAFVEEVKIARECEQDEPGALRAAADVEGLSEDFEYWEKILSPM